MHQQLPRDIDPFRFAHNGVQISGTLPVASLTRLADKLANQQGEIQVTLQFDVDQTGTPYVEGHFSGELALICERCMQAMPYKFDIKSLLALVRHERKIEGLAEQYEPWLLENSDAVNPADLVEDEIILALPLVPRHEQACLPDELWSSGEQEIETEKPVSPFAVLSALKTKKEH
ncbi:YceD family protein [Methylophaga lonarensis]|nr:YceD family protein [Methylophaga lonarensis]